MCNSSQYPDAPLCFLYTLLQYEFLKIVRAYVTHALLTVEMLHCIFIVPCSLGSNVIMVRIIEQLKKF